MEGIDPEASAFLCGWANAKERLHAWWFWLGEVIVGTVVGTIAGPLVALAVILASVALLFSIETQRALVHQRDELRARLSSERTPPEEMSPEDVERALFRLRREDRHPDVHLARYLRDKGYLGDDELKAIEDNAVAHAVDCKAFPEQQLPIDLLRRAEELREERRASDDNSAA